MDAVKMLNEFKRLTKNCQIDCNECRLGKHCHFIRMNEIEKFVAIVEQWSKDCPAKTYQEDFIEKFPNCAKYKDGKPKVCVQYIYGKNSCEQFNSVCADCWNSTMED